MRIFQTFIWDPSDFISVILSSPNDNHVYIWARKHGNKYTQNHLWGDEKSEYSDGVYLSEFYNILYLYTVVYF